jgi:hypothetical protein
VVRLLRALDLPPAVGEQAAVSAGRALAELVRVRHLHVEALDPDLSVVRHAPQGTSAADPGSGGIP